MPKATRRRWRGSNGVSGKVRAMARVDDVAGEEVVPGGATGFRIA